MQTTIGGDRLGSGNKQEVSMKNYERSTHDLSYLWRSSMAAGTLVPFMSEVGLPGDTFDIDLNCEVMTLPTIGPLFGSFKVQLDVFECPVRLYNGKLHMNMLNIGMDMSQIFLPQLHIETSADYGVEDNAQINPSSIASYLGIRGVGRPLAGQAAEIGRDFNAVPLLGYWDIYKQYYANKQEEKGVVIHNPMSEVNAAFISSAIFRNNTNVANLVIDDGCTFNNAFIPTSIDITLQLPPNLWNTVPEIDLQSFQFSLWRGGTGVVGTPTITELFQNVTISNYVDAEGRMYLHGDTLQYNYTSSQLTVTDIQQFPEDSVYELVGKPLNNTKPQLVEFPLSNIDDMRMDILADVKNTNPFYINKGISTAEAPYGLLKGVGLGGHSLQSSQEGLGIKTYQSDLFNNWIDTEWIDGTNGVNEVTAVSTSGDSFTIDALNLANKVYNMLNRIAISGGTYDDWLDSVYTHERAKSTENPIYHGSLIKELGFEEVISTADSDQSGDRQPLGTLAGRGRLTSKNKGGSIKIKVNEPSYIIGIVSLTPRIDYSQGNKWDVNLKSMNDFHKPALDAIGYQDLITDQMAWQDTVCEDDGGLTFSSAGKQPAWMNYMTNVNRVYGNFAIQEQEMYMTLNRRYEIDPVVGITDLTTYIDPSKYNNIFAQTSLDSQNFWCQISVNNTARRKMSAKVIPNL
jgi:hypothetical protein